MGLYLGGLLASMKIPTTVYEAREEKELGIHPQAHYLSSRTMEILAASPSSLGSRVYAAMEPRKGWECYSYGNAVDGNPWARVNHFQDPATSDLSIHYPFPSGDDSHLITTGPCRNQGGRSEVKRVEYSPGNLPSSKLIPLLLEWAREGVRGEYLELKTGYRVEETQVRDWVRGGRDRGFVVGADGSKSVVGKVVLGGGCGGEGGYVYHADKDLQSLINVHFDLPASRSGGGGGGGKGKGKDGDEGGDMLSFVFNENVIGVFVNHGLVEGGDRRSWVAQIPYFPQWEEPERYTGGRVKELIQSAFPNSGLAPSDIRVHSTAPWSMTIKVARSYRPAENVVLVGDAAHEFPPAGGFGLNTGIGDAHSLAWRIGRIVKSSSGDADGDADALLDEYSRERRDLATQVAILSVDNFRRVLDITSSLGLPASAVRVANSVASALPIPKSLKSALFTPAVSVAQRAALTSPSRFALASVRRKVLEGASIPLLFPGQDLGFTYFEKTRHPLAFPLPSAPLSVGSRFPIQPTHRVGDEGGREEGNVQHEARNSPEGENLTEETPLEWPSRVAETVYPGLVGLLGCSPSSVVVCSDIGLCLLASEGQQQRRPRRT